MSSAQDWYARKLGVQQPQQPQYRGQQPAYQTPSRQPDYSTQRQHADAPPDAPPPPGSVTLHNFVEMMSRWRGGAATKNETQNCPDCGSPNFFSRSNSVTRFGAPAPHCYNCGYCGLFPTQGDPTVWGAA